MNQQDGWLDALWLGALVLVTGSVLGTLFYFVMGFAGMLPK